MPYVIVFLIALSMSFTSQGKPYEARLWKGGVLFHLDSEEANLDELTLKVETRKDKGSNLAIIPLLDGEPLPLQPSDAPPSPWRSGSPTDVPIARDGG